MAHNRTMPRIITPFGNFEIGEDGQRQLERAIQTGERYAFKIDGSGTPAFLKGRVRRHQTSPHDYVLDLSPSA